MLLSTQHFQARGVMTKIFFLFPVSTNKRLIPIQQNSATNRNAESLLELGFRNFEF
ncbi:ATP/GTP-binding motif-containing protein [Tolypothrix sp. PCC 7601]|nr:ATP/GTP-binding motif-containing protein [Tolypothrix sp. PCC 7601]